MYLNCLNNETTLHVMFVNIIDFFFCFVLYIKKCHSLNRCHNLMKGYAGLNKAVSMLSTTFKKKVMYIT